MLDALAPFTELSLGALYGLILVFVRVSATVALLPGFGEQSLPSRVRLAAAVSFTFMVWPLVAADLPPLPDDMTALLPLFLTEAGIGMAFGVTIRMAVMALQLTGSIAAQATSLSQIMGAGATPDPMPAIGNILIMAGLALALAAGLHVRAVIAMAEMFKIFPLATLPDAGDFAQWGVSRAAGAFALAFTLAAPFVIASFAYNVALGVINRAMPQLLVAFIGAPAITAAGILILLLASPLILSVWVDHLNHILVDPFMEPE